MSPQIIPIKIDATATLEDTLSQINPAINAAHGAAKSSLLCFKVIPTLRFPFLINGKRRYKHISVYNAFVYD